MSGPIPAQKSPYPTDVEAGKEYWWCACGRSAGQPFCDGAHKAVGMTPVMFQAAQTEQAWLCGCKATKNPPFCDGSHNKI
jgi:CDGSH-type Zn-finger protein